MTPRGPQNTTVIMPKTPAPPNVALYAATILMALLAGFLVRDAMADPRVSVNQPAPRATDGAQPIWTLVAIAVATDEPTVTPTPTSTPYPTRIPTRLPIDLFPTCAPVEHAGTVCVIPPAVVEPTAYPTCSAVPGLCQWPGENGDTPAGVETS
jgi:hypothetical protein